MAEAWIKPWISKIKGQTEESKDVRDIKMCVKDVFIRIPFKIVNQYENVNK